MRRIARVVVVGVAHHVPPRGNRRGQVFFSDAGYAFYLELAAAANRLRGLEVVQV